MARRSSARISAVQKFPGKRGRADSSGHTSDRTVVIMVVLVILASLISVMLYLGAIDAVDQTQLPVIKQPQSGKTYGEVTLTILPREEPVSSAAAG